MSYHCKICDTLTPNISAVNKYLKVAIKILHYLTLCLVDCDTVKSELYISTAKNITLLTTAHNTTLIKTQHYSQLLTTPHCSQLLTPYWSKHQTAHNTITHTTPHCSQHHTTHNTTLLTTPDWSQHSTEHNNTLLTTPDWSKHNTIPKKYRENSAIEIQEHFRKIHSDSSEKLSRNSQTNAE
jgi:hypothetical protein